MADQKITQLTELAETPDDADILAIVDDVAETPITKKITVANLKAAGGVTEEQLKTVTVSLSAANIISMYATPIQVIAAPGAGKVVTIDQVVWSFTYGGTAFTGGAVPRIVEETSSALMSYGPPTAGMTGTADFIEVGRAQIDANDTMLQVVNKAMLVTNPTGAFADGNSTMKLFIRYRIITL